MGIFDIIEQALGEHGLRSLLIGAHALSFYRVTRETADLDLLISRDQTDGWKQFLAEKGYSLFHAGENFLQYSPPAQGAWPVDLMIVAGGTFERMWTAGTTVTVESQQAVVPSLMHLTALKLHALKYTHPRRTIKDFQDIVELVRENAIDLDSPEIKEWYLRYGTQEWYDKIRLASQ